MEGVIMDLVAIINQYYSALKIKYAQKLLPGHHKALNAICRCRTPDSGELFVQCPDCAHGEWKPLSCGHRSCPKCQNHEASLWIDRQQGKLLPVLYFMTTFTLPYELRSLTWYHQTRVYSIFFACVASTLKDFGFLHGNAKKLLALVQLALHVIITGAQQRPRPVFKCPSCKTAMIILGFRQFNWESG